MQDATADVYQRPTFTRNGIDFSDPILTIIESIRTASAGFPDDFGIASAVLDRVNDDDTGNESVDLNNLGPNGLLQFGVSGSRREMRVSDRFALINSGVGVATVYMYTATGGEFAFAENTGNQKAAADLVSGEFYLDDNWAETTDIAEAMGITPVQCATNYVRQPDMTSCACPANLPVEQGGMCVAATPTLTCDAASTTGQNGDECTCRDGFTERVSPEMCQMPQNPPDENPQTGNNTQTSGGESESKAAKVIGVVGIGMAIFVIANGGLFSDAFAFSPDFGYSLTENGYTINGGGKISYSAENLQMYWTAKQTNANGNFGDFRYVSEAKYKTDLFAATFSESVRGETADYDFSLSANLRGGIWKISPVYRLHSEYEKGEFSTDNSLNLQSEFRYNNWQIRPTAGFQWKNANGFAENARFQINAVHRF